MIFQYKASAVGPYHMKNQDSCEVRETEDFMIGVVADGVGSQIHSDIGSGIGAKASVEYCAENLKKGMTAEEIKRVMNNAFVYAYQAILDEAEKQQEYAHDTTLCMAVYDGSTLYYFQSGDSGIVVLLMDGSYQEVTRQQRDEEDRVFPLCSGPDYWEFGIVEEVASVLLMTDGVLEKVCHPLLKGEEVKIDVELATLLMAKQGIAAEDVMKLEAAAQQFLELYPVQDDKTVVVLWNNDCKPALREDAYYKKPDWRALQEKCVKELFDEADTVEPASDDAETVLEKVDTPAQVEETLLGEKKCKKKENKKKRKKKHKKQKQK